MVISHYLNQRWKCLILCCIARGHVVDLILNFASITLHDVWVWIECGLLLFTCWWFIHKTMISLTHLPRRYHSCHYFIQLLIPFWINWSFFCDFYCRKQLRHNGHHFPDSIFKCIFLNENAFILTDISLNFIPVNQINKKLSLVQIWLGTR